MSSSSFNSTNSNWRSKGAFSVSPDEEKQQVAVLANLIKVIASLSELLQQGIKDDGKGCGRNVQLHFHTVTFIDHSLPACLTVSSACTIYAVVGYPMLDMDSVSLPASLSYYICRDAYLGGIFPMGIMQCVTVFVCMMCAYMRALL